MKSLLKHIIFLILQQFSNQELSHKNEEICISKGILYLEYVIAFTLSDFMIVFYD